MIKYNEVTWYSKLVAGILFIIVPILAFCLGIEYQKINSDILNSEATVVPTPANLLNSAQQVLTALNTKDYTALEALVSSEGLSINEVPQLDLTTADIAKSDISHISSNPEIYLFGYADGSGEPIELTQAQYFTQYIYNHDYQNAPDIAVNVTVGNGNSINSIPMDVGTRNFVAFHFKGFNPDYGGMDWTTLYLVFDLENGKYTLRGIAKDNWTI